MGITEKLRKAERIRKYWVKKLSPYGIPAPKVRKGSGTFQFLQGCLLALVLSIIIGSPMLGSSLALITTGIVAHKTRRGGARVIGALLMFVTSIGL